MYAALPLLRSMGLHVLPGVICVALGALLLSCWELRRLTIARSSATHRRLLPATGIAVGVMALCLIVGRFIVVHLSARPTALKDLVEKVEEQ
jgi:hypothetical protein